MIRLFEQNILPIQNTTTKRWTWPGLGIGAISDAISCYVEEERNGKYELTMEYPVTGLRYNDIQINRVLVARPNHSSDDQGFRIYQISKSFEKVITVKAEHISYQLSHVPVLPLSAKSCSDAMNLLFSAANQTEPCPFEGSTNKTSKYTLDTEGSVITTDYDGRSLKFAWEATSSKTGRMDFNWTLTGVGKLANYTNGWVYCGPVSVIINGKKIIDGAFDHPNRLKLYENQIAASGSSFITWGEGATSVTVEVTARMYYDEEITNAELGIVKGSGSIITPKNPGGDTGDTVGEFKIDTPTSLRAALGGQNGSLLSVYGGEFEWDNLTVKLLSARGRNNGVTIRYGKNLTSLEQEETIAKTYTGITPYWKGTEPETNSTVIVTLTHILVDGVPVPDVPTSQTQDSIHSENADKFPYRRTVPMDFTSYFKNDRSKSEQGASRSEQFWYSVPLPNELNSVAQEWLDGSDIGVPEVNLNISYVPLWQTEEYKDRALLEAVGLCDVVTVYFEELGVNASAKVTATKYNVLLERYDEIKLSSAGKLQASLASTIASQPKALELAVQETQNFMTQALEYATNQIAGNFGGRIHYNKDADGNTYEMVIAGNPEYDPSSGEATYGNFMRFNSAGIGFSTSGYNGPFNSAWTIDGTFDAQVINVINLNANSITTGVFQSDNYDGTKGFYMNVDDGRIFAPSLSISTGQVSGLDGKIQEQAEIAIDESGIKTEIQKLEKDLDALQIGGTNICRQTHNMSREGQYMWRLYKKKVTDGVELSSVDGTQQRFPVPGVIGAAHCENKGTTVCEESGVYQRIGNTSSADVSFAGFHAGSKYSIGCWIRASVEGLPIMLNAAWKDDSAHTPYEEISATTTEKWQFVKLEGGLLTGNQFDEYAAGYAVVKNLPVGAWFEVCGLKVEIGDKATMWSPAPDDVTADYESQINIVRSDVSNLNQTADSLKSSVESRVTISEYNANNEVINQIIETAKSEVKQYADGIEVNVTNQIQGVKGVTDNVSAWLKFDAVNALTIGKEGSTYNTQITDEAFKIMQGTNEIGSFSSVGLKTDAVVLKESFSLPPFVINTIGDDANKAWLLTLGE